MSGLTNDMLSRGQVGRYKEESKRGAASERTPLSSATPARGWVATVMTNRARRDPPSPPLPPPPGANPRTGFQVLRAVYF